MSTRTSTQATGILPDNTTQENLISVLLFESQILSGLAAASNALPIGGHFARNQIAYSTVRNQQAQNVRLNDFATSILWVSNCFAPRHPTWIHRLRQSHFFVCPALWCQTNTT